MILIIERISAILLGAVLIFNMTARRHLERGSKKRMASLLFAVCILVFYLGVLAVKQNAMPLSFLYPVFAMSFLLLLALKKRIFIFRRRCDNCGGKYTWKDILYTDEPVCEKCTESSETYDQSIPEDVGEIDWDKWKPTEKAVICYIVDRENNKVLLINKKTGLGAGKVSAPGGRLEPGETFKEAVFRECIEETGIRPLNPEKRMELNFQFTNGYALYGEAFFAFEWEGDPMETEEADPFWCDLNTIPWDRMWEDDINWLPGALKGKKQRGRYIFDDDEMLSEDLVSLEKFED